MCALRAHGLEQRQGCGSQIEITVNGKPVVEDVTVISEGCDVEEYLKVGVAAMVVVGDRPTLLQLVKKVGGGNRFCEGAGGRSAIVTRAVGKDGRCTDFSAVSCWMGWWTAQPLPIPGSELNRHAQFLLRVCAVWSSCLL